MNEDDLLLPSGTKVRVTDREGKKHVGTVLQVAACRQGIVYSVALDSGYTVNILEKDVRKFDEAG